MPRRECCLRTCRDDGSLPNFTEELNTSNATSDYILGALANDERRHVLLLIGFFFLCILNNAGYVPFHRMSRKKHVIVNIC